MLARLVRPVKRRGSRYRQFVRRIPADVKDRAAGLTLHIPVGEQTQVVVLSLRAQTVRLSLRTDDPVEVKARMAAIDAYLEKVWQALRDNAPVSLIQRQATALGGELYWAWANGEGREHVTAVEHDPHFLHPEDHILVRGADGCLARNGVTQRLPLCATHFGWKCMGGFSDMFVCAAARKRHHAHQLPP
jgi:hypothetical protein